MSTPEPGWAKLPAFVSSVWACVFDVLSFWQLKLASWWTHKKPCDVLLDALASAETQEDYHATCLKLDEILNYDLWRQNPASKYYDSRLIYHRLLDINRALEQDDIIELVSLLRSGLVRNLGNITSPKLFNRAYAGTKLLIENYITQVALAVDHVTSYPVTPEVGLTQQGKLDILHDTRKAFGRSALVLQGGAIFGLCHLGVVRALHLNGLLPRIIAGTATGALIAALVCVHTEDELLNFTQGSNIDLSAFTQKVQDSAQSTWYQTLMRRIRRYRRDGHFLDVKVLEDVVKANVGDLTFEEAYEKTKRILNITVSTTGGGGIPHLLNYITAPNVLIWSAAVASNASSSESLYEDVKLLCKDENGEVTSWSPSPSTSVRPWTHASYADGRKSPLHRIAELFSVNHYIVSQARPYLVPFLRSDLHRPSSKHDSRRYNISALVLRIVVMEIQHRLRQLDDLGFLSPSIRRFLLDEKVPGPSLTIVPEIKPSDFFRLLENPTVEGLDYWIKRGEKMVWPAVDALKVRCAIEVEIERGYQLVRRRRRSGPREKSTDGGSNAVNAGGERLRRSGSGGRVVEENERRRSASFGEGLGRN